MEENGTLGLRMQRIGLPSGEIAYVDEGTGRPVLLLHGAPSTALGFVRVIRALRARYRVIAPDLPGFGASRAAPGFAATLSAYARFVEEFCHALGLRDMVLYVNDSSGCFGLAAAAALAPQVSGIVVADTVPIPMTGRAWVVRLALRHVVTSRAARALNRRYNMLPWLAVTVAPLRRPFTPAERRVLLAQFDDVAKRERVLDLLAAMGRDDAFMRRTAHEVGARLGGTPALVLFGQFDPMRAVGGAARFCRLLPRASVCVIPLEEHFPIFAEGERVAAAICDFADRLAPCAS